MVATANIFGSLIMWRHYSQVSFGGIAALQAARAHVSAREMEMAQFKLVVVLLSAAIWVLGSALLVQDSKPYAR
jgi:hypothetical protein